MEMQQVVVLSETGQLQLTSLSRHILYHTASVLLPNQSMHAVLPRSGSIKVESLCNDLPQCISVKNLRKKQISLSGSGSLGNPLVPSLEIHKFLEHATSIVDFTLLLEKHLLELSGGEIDPDKLHEICWGVYEMEKGQEISIRQWFSPTCTYRLWLVFCCVQEQVLGDTLSAVTANEVIKRLVELCGYTWNEAYSYAESTEVTFSQYLRAIASYFTRLKLDMSLTCEVIGDMVDEIVHGVLKKGFLQKKGHKRKNWNRRWFVLQRTTMKYFENRETMTLKGQLVLNSKTEVIGKPDKGKRKCLFEVTCGHTGKPFEISADDQRTKQEWMLAIKKAIALAKVLDGSSKQDDFTEYLSGFYLLKYGTPQPFLSRQDSTVRNMKYHATMKDQRKRLSGRKITEERDITLSDSGSYGGEERRSSTQEEYTPMCALNREGNISSDESSGEDSYTSMSPIRESKNLKSGLSRSMEFLDATPSDAGMELGHGQQWDVSRSYSQSTCRTQGMLIKSSFIPVNTNEDDESSDSSDNVYDEAEITPRYTINPGAKDKKDSELGGYIDVVKLKNTENSFTGKKPDSLTMSLHEPIKRRNSSDDDEVSQLTAHSLKLDVLMESERASSPNKYLTIVRGQEPGNKSEERVHKAPPPPPPHNRDSSLSPDSTLSPKASTTQPPPLLPRPKVYRKVSSPIGPVSSKSLSSGSHSTSQASQELRHQASDSQLGITTRTVSHNYNNPPLPPRY